MKHPIQAGCEIEVWFRELVAWGKYLQSAVNMGTVVVSYTSSAYSLLSLLPLKGSRLNPCLAPIALEVALTFGLDASIPKGRYFSIGRAGVKPAMLAAYRLS